MSTLADRLEALEKAGEYGPLYPNLGPSVAKFRRQVNPDPKAYGQAVRASIRALQRTELQREIASHRSPSASGTWHAEGKAIRKAIAKQHRASLQAALNGPTFVRDDHDYRLTYLERMLERYGVDSAKVHKAWHARRSTRTLVPVPVQWLQAALNVARRAAC